MRFFLYHFFLFVSFLNRIRLIEYVMQVGTDVQTHELVGVGIRTHPIREEDDHQTVFRVGPYESPRKSRVTIASHRARLGCRAGTFLVERQLVEANPTTVFVGRCKMSLGEIAYRLWLKVPLAMIGTTIEEHLHDGGQVMGVAKQASVTSHAAKHGCGLIVHIAPKLLHTEAGRE